MSANPGTAPVFVDDTGRRRTLTRRAGRIVVIGFTAYIGLLVIGFARDPRIGPIHLPTFGVPSLGLVVPPDPSPGEQEVRTASEAAIEADDASAGSAPKVNRADVRPGGDVSRAGGPAGTPGVLAPASGGDLSPVGPGAASPPSGSGTTTTSAPTTTTTSGDHGNGPPWSATSTSSTTSSSTTSTSTTTSTTKPGQGSGRDDGQGSGSASTPGPDGAGAPGQLRKTTTTTAG